MTITVTQIYRDSLRAYHPSRYRCGHRLSYDDDGTPCELQQTHRGVPTAAERRDYAVQRDDTIPGYIYYRLWPRLD